jgi:hypothetical protein
MAVGQSKDALATCYGSPFEVYLPKEFPGLRPSTELTQVRSIPQSLMAVSDQAVEAFCPSGSSG